MEKTTFLVYYLLPTFKVKYEIAKVLVKETPGRREDIVSWLLGLTKGGRR